MNKDYYDSIGIVQKTPSVGPTTETQFVSMHDAAFECQSYTNHNDDSNVQTVTLSPRRNATGHNNYQFTQQQDLSSV